MHRRDSGIVGHAFEAADGEPRSAGWMGIRRISTRTGWPTRTVSFSARIRAPMGGCHDAQMRLAIAGAAVGHYYNQPLRPATRFAIRRAARQSPGWSCQETGPFRSEKASIRRPICATLACGYCRLVGADFTGLARNGSASAGLEDMKYSACFIRYR